MTDLNLDFSGGENSWFDLWHEHPDMNGKGNGSPSLRTETLNKLLETYSFLKTQLKSYPDAYQIWMLVSENDSGEDAVYIHTANPNGTPFPIQLDFCPGYNGSTQQINEFVGSTGFTVAEAIFDDEKYFYLFENGVGEKLR